MSNLADIKGEEAAIQEFLGLVQANVSPLDAAIQVHDLHKVFIERNKAHWDRVQIYDFNH